MTENSGHFLWHWQITQCTLYTSMCCVSPQTLINYVFRRNFRFFFHFHRCGRKIQLNSSLFVVFLNIINFQLKALILLAPKIFFSTHMKIGIILANSFTTITEWKERDCTAVGCSTRHEAHVYTPYLENRV